MRRHRCLAEVGLRVLCICVIAFVVFASSGCFILLAGGAAGTGVAYAGGDLEALLKADPPAVAEAAEGAFKALEIAKVSAKSTGLDAEIIGRTAQDTRIMVKVVRKTEGVSEISIRVGTFGDKKLSLAVYDEIKKRL